MQAVYESARRGEVVKLSQDLNSGASQYSGAKSEQVPDHRGCGVGTAAQGLLAEYLFAHTTAHRLEATTGIDNVAEQRALEHAGFTQEGLLRGRGWLDGEWRDGYIYARLRTDPPPS